LNTEIKIPENRIDLINVVFTQLEITYHNQFHKAFPDSDSLKLAKQLWLKKLSIFENEIIFKSIDKIMSNSEYLPSLSAVLQKCKFLTLDANGVPSLEKCFIEASTFCDAPSEHSWSHPIVYFAGKKVGWSYLSEKDSKEAFEVFKKIFNSLKRQAKDGINFEIKDKKEKTYTKSFDKKLFKELRKKYKV